jgi:hypothetical protein
MGTSLSRMRELGELQGFSFYTLTPAPLPSEGEGSKG